MAGISVKAVPLKKLRPATWNPRTIRDERFKNLCRSIEADPAFLWRRPVLAQADGTIYAGNMRYRAAEHLGLATIPAVVEDVPDALAKERALRDNHSWGDWEGDLLAELVGELQDAGSELELLGFEEKELARLLGVDEPDAGSETRTANFEYTEKFGVTVLCEDEAHQAATYEALKAQGYECRVVVV